MAVDPATLTPQQLLTSAKRELQMRKRVYPHRVSIDKMTQQAADYEIGCQQAIVDLLDRHAQGRLF